MGSLQGMTSSFQYGNRTFTGKVTFRERSHTIVRALDGRLSYKGTNFSEYLQAIQVYVRNEVVSTMHRKGRCSIQDMSSPLDANFVCRIPPFLF